MKKLILFFFLLILTYSIVLAEPNIIIAFRNDDISAVTDQNSECEIIEIFDEFGIKPLYAVIPKIEGKTLTKGMGIVDSLNKWEERGLIEIAQHGFIHEKNKFSSGEFGKLTYKEQLIKIKEGKKIIDRVLEMNVSCFCPPWNVTDKKTLAALSACGFTCVSGYVGSTSPSDLFQIDTNCNLFDGPLGNVMEAYKYAINSKQDNILLVVLFHSSYDFDQFNLQALKNILKTLRQEPGVKFVSFSDLQSPEYSQIVDTQNRLNDLIYEFWKNYKVRIVKKVDKIFGIQFFDFDEIRNQIRISVWENDLISLQNLLSDASKDINLYLLVIFSVSIFIIILFVYIGCKYKIFSIFKKKKINS